jgi:predicted nucleic acid-binding protein
VSKVVALLDSNVVIASVAAEHEHHQPSAALLNEFSPRSFAVAAHSYSEAYSGLTRRSRGAPFEFDSADAMAALESVAAHCVLVGLTHAQTFEAIRDFAGVGGLGPRLYDKLIGETAVVNGIACIITWNMAHFTGLFPTLTVVDPEQFATTQRDQQKGHSAE